MSFATAARDTLNSKIAKERLSLPRLSFASPSSRRMSSLDLAKRPTSRLSETTVKLGRKAVSHGEKATTPLLDSGLSNSTSGSLEGASELELKGVNISTTRARSPSVSNKVEKNIPSQPKPVDESFHCLVYPGNNHEIVTSILARRAQWKFSVFDKNEELSAKKKKVDFIWGFGARPLPKDIYIHSLLVNNCHKNSCQIAAKGNFVANFLCYCFDTGMNPFDYIPFSLIIDTSFLTKTHFHQLLRIATALDNKSKAKKKAEKASVPISDSSSGENYSPESSMSLSQLSQLSSPTNITPISPIGAPRKLSLNERSSVSLIAKEKLTKVNEKSEKTTNANTPLNLLLVESTLQALQKLIDNKDMSLFDSSREMLKSLISTCHYEKKNRQEPVTMTGIPLDGKAASMYSKRAQKKLFEKINSLSNCILPSAFFSSTSLQPAVVSTSSISDMSSSQSSESSSDQCLWILKPAALSRGRGITVCSSLKEIVKDLQEGSLYENESEEKYLDTGSSVQHWVIQKYIERPLLYKKRKFDIRMWAYLNSQMEIHLFDQGYIRTSATELSYDSLSPEIHLTNNCVQKNMSNYNMYEDGNALNFEEFDEYCRDNTQLPKDMYLGRYEGEVDSRWRMRIEDLITVAFSSVSQYFFSLRERKNKNNFQLYGIDFMIDEDGQIWLIEVNSSPSLSPPSAKLKPLFEDMLHQLFQNTIDKVFPSSKIQESKEVHYSSLVIEEEIVKKVIRNPKFQFVCTLK